MKTLQEHFEDYISTVYRGVNLSKEQLTQIKMAFYSSHLLCLQSIVELNTEDIQSGAYAFGQYYMRVSIEVDKFSKSLIEMDEK